MNFIGGTREPEFSLGAVATPAPLGTATDSRRPLNYLTVTDQVESRINWKNRIEEQMEEILLQTRTKFNAMLPTHIYQGP